MFLYNIVKILLSDWLIQFSYYNVRLTENRTTINVEGIVMEHIMM